MTHFPTSSSRSLRAASPACIIRQARPADWPAFPPLYEEARRRMVQCGNPHQWPSGYPDAEILRADIELKNAYVVELEGRIVAAFVLIHGADPTYAQIEQGEWLNPHVPYATLHRLAASAGVHGVGRMVINWCKKQGESLRADTHRDNAPMHHLLQTEGFVKAGIIHVADGTERIAYQFLPQRPAKKV